MNAEERDQEELWGAAFEPPEPDRGSEALVIDVDGFEGPLDLLLALARTQKVDLTRISILALAEQYLTYVEQARGLRLELAADYLVMAAWLAYLKSRLLLPQESNGEEPSGEEMAAELAFRLRRLEAMRDAANRLANRDRLGRDVFGRASPEPVEIIKRGEFSATLYDLLTAYAAMRQQTMVSEAHKVRLREVWSLQEARDALTRMIGRIAEWTPMEVLVSSYFATPAMRRSVTASTFGASLELVREGKIELRQTEHFQPLYVRDRPPPVAVVIAVDNDATAMNQSPEERRQDLRMIEALLFASAEPLSADVIASRLPEGTDVAGLLRDVQAMYVERGVNLVQVAGKWMFRTAGDLSFLLSREAVEQKKLSRAALETLAIIAYHQPVTRADIEEIRGVATSKGTLDVLMETGWIRMRGRRRSPGRPVTYGVTETFLAHFGLDTVADLPGAEELRAAGLLDSRVPANFALPEPNVAAGLAEDEDPLEDGDIGGPIDEDERE
jgi:segregation and condensation protein B